VPAASTARTSSRSHLRALFFQRFIICTSFRPHSFYRKYVPALGFIAGQAKSCPDRPGVPHSQFVHIPRTGAAGFRLAFWGCVLESRTVLPLCFSLRKLTAYARFTFLITLLFSHCF